MKIIGIFGGAFNPVTKAHINIAQKIIDEKIVDEIWFMPAANHPDKDKLQPFLDRFKMINDIIKDIPNMEVKDLELYSTNNIKHKKSIGTSYKLMKNIINIEYGKKHIEPNVFYFILGSDRVKTLESWYKLHKLSKLVKFIAVNRDNLMVRNKYILEYVYYKPNYSISSSIVRKMFFENRKKKDFKPYIYDKTYNYIKEKNMYKYII